MMATPEVFTETPNSSQITDICTLHSGIVYNDWHEALAVSQI